MYNKHKIRLPVVSVSELQDTNGLFRSLFPPHGFVPLDYNAIIHATITFNAHNDVLHGQAEMTGYYNYSSSPNDIYPFHVNANFTDDKLNGELTMYWYDTHHNIVSISQMLYDESKPMLSIDLMDNELLLNTNVTCSYTYPNNVTLHTLLLQYPSLSPQNSNWETKITTAQKLCQL